MSFWNSLQPLGLPEASVRAILFLGGTLALFLYGETTEAIALIVAYPIQKKVFK